MSTKMHEAALAAQAGTATPEQLAHLVQITDPTITGQYGDSSHRMLIRKLTELYHEGQINGKELTDMKMMFSQWDEDVAAWKQTLIQFMKLPWKDPAAAESAYKHLARLGEDHLLGEIQKDMDQFERQLKSASDTVRSMSSDIQDNMNNYMQSIDTAMNSAIDALKLG